MAPRPSSTLLLALLIWLPAGVVAQVDGSLSETLAGAALGAYSGAALGLVGSIFPCNRMVDGRRCVVSTAGTGAALGLAMGGFLGSQNTDALGTRFEGAGIGVGAGAIAGLAVSALVDSYGWADVGSFALVGGAVGASPYGAMLGAGLGIVIGGATWAVRPDGGVQDLVMVTLMGIAVGGLVDWADGAADRQRTGYRISFSIGT